MLLKDGVTGRALVLQSPFLTGEAFALTSLFNSAADQRTRVMLFSINIDPSISSNLSVRAISIHGVTYELPIEYVGKVSAVDSITTLIVILPQDPALHGDLSVSLTVAGIRSNEVVFAIQ